MKKNELILLVVFIILAILRALSFIPISYVMIAFAFAYSVLNFRFTSQSASFIILVLISFFFILLRQFSILDLSGLWLSFYSFAIYFLLYSFSSVVADRIDYYDFLRYFKAFLLILLIFDLFHPASSFFISSTKSTGLFLHGVHEFGRILLLYFFVDYLLNHAKIKFFKYCIFLTLLLLAKARSELMSILIFGFIYYSNLLFFRHHFLSRLFVLLFVVILVIFTPAIITELKTLFDDSVISESLKISSRFTDDSTSGRSWLWNYHLDLFNKSPVFGVGLESVSFAKGDVINNVIAPAGSESGVTQFIAGFGLFIFFHSLPIIYWFNLSLRFSSLALISISLVPLIAFLSLFANPVSYWSQLFFVFLVTSIVYYEKSFNN